VVTQTPNREQRRHPDRSDEWMSPLELSERLGIPLGTIYQWRVRQLGPKAHKFGRHVRYRESNVEIWITEQES